MTCKADHMTVWPGHSILGRVLMSKTASQVGQSPTIVASGVPYGSVKSGNRAGMLVKEMMQVPKVNHVTPYSTLTQFFRKGPSHLVNPGEFHTGLFDLTLSKSPGYGTSVHGSSVPSKMMGIGMGRKMYGNAIRQAYQDYIKGGDRYFYSDPEGLTSRHAQRMWNSLSRRGYPVQTGGELPLGRGSSNIMFGIDLDKMKNFYKDANFGYSSWRDKYLPDSAVDGLVSSIPLFGQTVQKARDFDNQGPEFGLSRSLYTGTHPAKTLTNILAPALGYRFAPSVINKSKALSGMADRLNVRMLGQQGSKLIPGASRRALGIIGGGLLGSSLVNGVLSARFTQKHASQQPEKPDHSKLMAGLSSMLPAIFSHSYMSASPPGVLNSMGSNESATFDKLKALGQSSGAAINSNNHIPKTQTGRAMLGAMHNRGGLYMNRKSFNPELFEDLVEQENKNVKGLINFGKHTPNSQLLAHELGHHFSPNWMTGRSTNISALLGQGFGGLPAMLSDNEDVGLTGAAMGTALSLPQLVSEFEASRKGRNLWRDAMGHSNFKKLPFLNKLGPFHGFPTYLAAASTPMLAYGTRKLMGGYDKQLPKDNSTFNWAGKIPW